MDQRSSVALRRLTTTLLLGTCFSPCPLWAADFTVSNNADSGAGSLRQAIIDSNSAGGSNNIIINSGEFTTYVQPTTPSAGGLNYGIVTMNGIASIPQTQYDSNAAT